MAVEAFVARAPYASDPANSRGRLHHVGVTSSFTMARRKELAEELAPLRAHALDEHPWREWAEAGGLEMAHWLEGAGVLTMGLARHGVGGWDFALGVNEFAG